MTTQEKYENRQGIEHELINRRLTWLLSSQSILFAALAFVLGKDADLKLKMIFFDIVSTLGLGISLLILLGVSMGMMAKYTSWYDVNKGVQKTGIPLGVRTWITTIAIIPDVCMPVLFAWAWWLIKMDLHAGLEELIKMQGG